VTSMGHRRDAPDAASAPRIDASHGEASCLMCSAPTSEADSCCSLACAEQAQRELRHNVANLRLLRLDDAASERRLRLAERNGRLSSALLRYRPTAQPG
jgi:predicted nucleic acid-binding Zn ribbon protein